MRAPSWFSVALPLPPLCCVAGLLLVSLPGSGQEGPTGAAPASAAGALGSSATAGGTVPSPAAAASPNTAGPTTTLRTSTRLVYVDVVVRDGAGHVVHGLKEGDFHLSENRQVQQVRFFAEHASDTGAEGTRGRPASAAGFANVPEGAADRSLNIVLFDLLNTDRADQTYARERMIAFLRKMPAGKQVALFVLGDRLTMVQGFTGDSAALARAAQGIDLKQMNRTRSAAQRVGDMDMEAYVDSQATIPQLGDLMKKDIIREDVSNMKARLDETGQAFTELAAAVNGFPGRKNLFWLAGQFPSEEYFRLQALSTQPEETVSTPGGGRPNPNASGGSTSDLARVALSERSDRAVADSQIAVYPISVLGVETDSIDASQSGIGTAGTQKVTDTAAAQFNDRAQIRSVMEHIADETGGEAFYGNNDVGAMLRRGLEDSENYYTLAYSPTDHDWNGKYRTIAVGLNGRGGTLSYRRGYVALPEQPVGNVMAEFQRAMRIDSPPATMLRLRAVPGASAGTLVLDARLDVAGVGFADEAGGKRDAHLVVGLMAYPYGAGEGAAPVQTSGKLHLDLTPEQYGALAANGVAVRQQLPLKPGRYVLRMGVVDVASGRIGTLTLPVEMP